ncbi:MAG: hypothetical protein IPH89_12440 [Bacteroidetes bacterium]|nr:hypothetical protein [Bacteroidota bacterium]
MNNSTFFELRNKGNFLKIEVIGYCHSEAELNYDKNWLSSIVQFNVGSFSGKFKAEMQTFDFEIFKKELEIAFDKLNRSATFETIEGQVNLDIAGDGVGHFEAKCLLMDQAGVGNELRCELELDQTQLPEIIDQLNKIIVAYPPIR